MKHDRQKEAIREAEELLREIQEYAKQVQREALNLAMTATEVISIARGAKPKPACRKRTKLALNRVLADFAVCHAPGRRR